jgi:hypothetical protein
MFATTAQLCPLIGRIGTIRHDDADLDVRILDARVRYGNVDLLVAATAGSWSGWIQRNHVTLPSVES